MYKNLIWYTNRSLTEEEVKSCVKEIAGIIKQNQDFLEQTPKINTEFNIDFIPVNAGSEAARFKFYSQCEADKKMLMAKELVGIKQPHNVISFTGELGMNSCEIINHKHYKILMDVAEKLNRASDNKLKFKALK